MLYGSSYLNLYNEKRKKKLSHTGGDAAAEDADLVERRRRVDLGDAADMDDGVLAERRGAEEVVHWLPSCGEPCLAVADHGTAVGVYAEEVAQVALLRQAVPAVAALAGEHRQHVVAGGKLRHPLAHTLHNPMYTYKQNYLEKFFSTSRYQNF